MSKHIDKPTDITIPAGSLWGRMPLIAGLVGLIGTGATIGMMFGAEKERAYFSYLFAFMTVLSLALAGLIFTLIQHVVRAGWSAVVRRLGETMMATLPLFAVLFLPIALLGFHTLYPWTHEIQSDPILMRKAWWLGEADFMTRAIVYFGVWIVLSQLLYRWSVRQDTMTDAAAREKLVRRLWTLSAGGIFLYALTQSAAAVDWLMSLQPHWYSTIFGVYYFAGGIVSFYALLALIAMSLQKSGVLKNAITTEHYHDLGKWTFGHTVFWAYIAFSQFVLIWYANIPEETEYFMHRVEGGWQYISYALPFTNFFIPFFFLVSRHVKRSRVGLAIGAVWTLVVHAVDIYWIVLPNFGTHGEGDHHPHLGLHWLDVAALVGIGGLFLAAFSWLLKRNKVVCINDPRLEESLAHENY